MFEYKYINLFFFVSNKIFFLDINNSSSTAWPVLTQFLVIVPLLVRTFYIPFMSIKTQSKSGRQPFGPFVSVSKPFEKEKKKRKKI